MPLIHRFRIVFLAELVAVCSATVVWGQGGIGVGRSFPFVIGVRPVVGPGVVGGVSVDAEGIVSRARAVEDGRLRERAREAVLVSAPADLERLSHSRKISLARLQRLVDEHRRAEKPLPMEAQFLAGLQRIEHVFVYPEQNDIVFAGLAEGWKLDESGAIVGNTTGRPVLRLEDLLIALRTAKGALETGIFCSIEPTPEGMKQLKRLTRRKLQMSRRTLAALERTLGPQQVRLGGLPENSRMARVLVAADYLMKRVAMRLEPSPVDEVPSYLELAADRRGKPPANMMPRWWIAPDYDPLAHSPDRLAWRLPASQVKVLTEESFFSEEGKLVDSRPANPTAQKWAETFTAHYAELSARLPALAELQNCIQLAVVAALLTKEKLPARAGLTLSLLTDAQAVPTQGHAVPKAVASQASFLRLSRGWLITLSGGVEVDSWKLAENQRESRGLAEERKKSVLPAEKRWWWD